MAGDKAYNNGPKKSRLEKLKNKNKNLFDNLEFYFAYPRNVEVAPTKVGRIK